MMLEKFEKNITINMHSYQGSNKRYCNSKITIFYTEDLFLE